MERKKTSEAYRAVSELRAANLRHEQRMKRDFDPDFDGPEELAELKAHMRSLQRRRQLPKDMKCPSCLIIKPNTRQWTSKGDMCRACFGQNGGIRQTAVKDVQVFIANGEDAQNSRTLIPGKLREIREKLGITCKDFGRHCRWSGSYQARLEKAGEYTVSLQARAAILNTIKILNSAEFRRIS